MESERHKGIFKNVFKHFQKNEKKKCIKPKCSPEEEWINKL